MMLCRASSTATVAGSTFVRIRSVNRTNVVVVSFQHLLDLPSLLPQQHKQQRRMKTTIRKPKQTNRNFKKKNNKSITSPSTTTNKRTGDIILYQRNLSSNTIPKGCLWLSYGNSIYWTWYAIDFIPTVNNSSIETLHVEPWIGILGCTIAYSMSFVSWAYCSRLISKIVMTTTNSSNNNNKKNPILQIFLHTFPFMNPSTSKSLEYEIGDIQLQQDTREVREFVSSLTMKSTTGQQHQPLVSYKGHLPLHANDRKWPLGLYINNLKEDIPHKNEFLDTLLLLPR